MSTNAPMSRGQSAAVLIALLFSAQTALAYDYPLHFEDIRNAFFLGERNNFQTTDRLLQYIHRFTGPQTGRYFVSRISISTPYQQILLRGRQDTPGDSEVQTETDLQTHPLKFIVRVRVEWNAGYPGAKNGPRSPWEFPGGSAIRVAQESEIKPIGVRYESFYADRIPMGETIELEYDPAKIDSAPLRIRVRKPDGRVLETEFNMSELH
ncbi:MAG: hypothetical protein ACYC92_04360 [Candidatus Acidiferrales bacterium]